MKDKEIEIKNGSENMVDLLNQEQAELQKAMIEEMANDLFDFRNAKNCCETIDCSSFVNRRFTCNECRKATILVNLGYQKLPKDSVVLSREELNEIIKQTKDIEKNYYKKVVIPQERKETAEKFFDKLWHSEFETTVTVKNSSDEDVEKVVKGILCSIRNKIKELAKQFGVEIKES